VGGVVADSGIEPLTPSTLFLIANRNREEELPRFPAGRDGQGDAQAGTDNLVGYGVPRLWGEEKAVDVGSFDYRGRSFVNAKAVVVSPNEVKVDGVSIPWTN
jgi:hypothetical protein